MLLFYVISMPVRFTRISSDAGVGPSGGAQCASPKSDPSYFQPETAGLRPAPKPPAGLWSSFALRFGGFTANLEALISPLCGGHSSDAVAKIFFREKIGDVARLASRNPLAAARIVRRHAENIASPWNDLLRVACGDSEALLNVLDSFDAVNQAGFTDAAISVARHRPLEGRLLLKHIFARAQNRERLKILRAFAENPQLDPKRSLGELFVQMMARSTPEERQREIYPGLLAIVSNPQAQNKPASSFLRALFRGWLTEDEGAASFLAQI